MSESVAITDQSGLRARNTAAVLSTLRREGELSRAQLARRLSLTRSTVSRIVGELTAAGYVHETRLAASGSGRPGMLLAIAPSGGCFVGVDLNIDVAGVVLTDFVGSVLWSHQVEVDPAEAQDRVLGCAEDLIVSALSRAPAAVLGIGVGAAALVDADARMILYAPHLGWRDVEIGGRWEQRFGLPVVVENEANAAAMGEHCFGHTQGMRNSIFISLGVGLAAGVFVNGALLRGAHGFAGQVGHTVRVPDGEQCLCGRRGCWVTQVGLPAISRRLRAGSDVSIPAAGAGAASPEGTRRHATIQAVTQALVQGDEAVQATLEETATWLGLGIADLANIFDPEAVVLGGALSPLIDPVLGQVQTTVSEHVLAGPRQSVQVVSSRHGAHACAAGAAACSLNDVTQGSVFTRG